MDPWRDDLPEAVHTVLRRWHTGQQEDLPWREMLTVAQRLDEPPAPNPDLAVKEIVLKALNTLEERGEGDGVQILRLRFVDGLTATATAKRLNLSQDVVYKRQRGAIHDLARIVWQAEAEARSVKRARIVGRLEIKEPPRLFGVNDKLAELTAALTSSGSPWLVAVVGVVGIGGIGKTSLADAAVRALAGGATTLAGGTTTLAGGTAFADVAWISARQERFVLWDGLQEGQETAPALTLEGLAEALIEQFGFQDLARYPVAQKQDSLRNRLRAQPYLVVVDNLETAADYQALVPDLQNFVNPSRVLLTSRYSLHDFPGTLNLSLDELSAADSLALLRHEAGERGIAGVSTAPDGSLSRVYEVAGGNPLALKLLVGQMHTLSLSRVVDDLRQAHGRKVEDLYSFIYRRSWQLLSEAARRVLAIMPLVAESGGGLAQIAALCEMDDEELAAGLQQLVALSLVCVQGTLEARRYSIHRLTETFLLEQVLRW